MDDLVKRIAAFFCSFSSVRRTVGSEKEMLLVDNDMKIGNVLDLFVYLDERLESSWKRGGYFESIPTEFEHRAHGVITCDAGMGTIEWASNPKGSIWELGHHFGQAKSLLKDAAEDTNQMFLGVGMHPFSKSGWNTWVHKERYMHLRNHYGRNIDPVSVSASSQTHVSAVNEEELLEQLYAFNAISGPLSALTANSPIEEGKPNGSLVTRQTMYDGFANQRSGIPETPFRSWDQFAEWVLEREYLFGPDGEGGYCSFGEKFESVVKSGENLEIHFPVHNSCLWHDARPRKFGEGRTIEVRPCCAQPAEAQMAPDALILGLAENLTPLVCLVNSIDWNHWKKIKNKALKKGLKSDLVFQKSHQLLEISRRGLEKRGKNEEEFLEPLYERLQDRETPAERQRELVKNKKLDQFLDEFRL